MCVSDTENTTLLIKGVKLPQIMPNQLSSKSIKIKPDAHGPQWLTWVSSYKSLIQHFSFSDAMAKKIKMSNLHKMFMLGGGLLNKQF